MYIIVYSIGMPEQALAKNGYIIQALQDTGSNFLVQPHVDSLVHGLPFTHLYRCA